MYGKGHGVHLQWLGRKRDTGPSPSPPPGCHQATLLHESTTLNPNRAPQAWKNHSPSAGWDTHGTLDLSSSDGKGRARCPQALWLSLPAPNLPKPCGWCPGHPAAAARSARAWRSPKRSQVAFFYRNSQTTTPNILHRPPRACIPNKP